MGDNQIDPPNNAGSSCKKILESLFMRCHDPDIPSSPQQPVWWNKYFPFPYFASYRHTIRAFCIVIIFLLIWGLLFAQLGEPASPSGELFSMALLVIVAWLVGWIWLKLTTLPALIGVLLTGIFLRNVGWLHETDQYKGLDQNLRKIALVIILTRAGLGLDAHVLKKHYGAVIKLGILPWLSECIAIGIITHYALNIPWIWGFLQGSMIASVSPAVVVPCLFKLREQGYGEAKGIPTMMLAGAAIDDSISVAIFSILLGAIWSSGSMVYNIIIGPASIVAGLVLGSLCGALLGIFPERQDPYVVPIRFCIIIFWGLFSLYVSSLIGWSGAGPLAAVCAGFAAAYFWNQQGWKINTNPVCEIFKILWIFFEPILFALTGAQITINVLDPDVVKLGLLSLAACLVIRLVTTFFSCFGCGLNTKEKFFIASTLLSKATVQAALGPAALDLVNSGRPVPNYTQEEVHRYAEIVVTMSVLSVLISAPLGAILISITGPRLLQRQTTLETAPKDDMALESGKL